MCKGYYTFGFSFGYKSTFGRTLIFWLLIALSLLSITQSLSQTARVYLSCLHNRFCSLIKLLSRLHVITKGLLTFLSPNTRQN